MKSCDILKWSKKQYFSKLYLKIQKCRLHCILLGKWTNLIMKGKLTRLLDKLTMNSSTDRSFQPGYFICK